MWSKSNRLVPAWEKKGKRNKGKEEKREKGFPLAHLAPRGFLFLPLIEQGGRWGVGQESK